jgi:hypothetical protein
MISARFRNSHGLVPVAALATCLLLSCAKDQLDREIWSKRGETALKPFKERLRSALIEGLESGPEEAIDVCRIIAPEIAEETSSRTVRVGRTSHRLRNRQNAPKEWMQGLLETYAANPGMTEPEVVSLGSGRVGYVEPIYVKPMCLACHGKTLSPSVAARLDEYYPGDLARGFDEGDFRGLFWVEFTETK